MFKCGIVGLPNVGKSTLFNALTATIAAEAANYPFCTIEPNIGRVSVPDERLPILANIACSRELIPTYIDIVDIAGLVRGASKGEGLGNQFLANIREVDAIIYVARCFIDENVTHVENSVDPIRDIELIETELALADLESISKRLENAKKKIKGGATKEFLAEIALMESCFEVLSQGKQVRSLAKSGSDYNEIRKLQLLTSKPVIYVCNVSEDEVCSGNDFSKKVEEYAKTFGGRTVLISAKIEAEIASLDSADEKQMFLESIGLKQTGLDKIIKAGYDILGLETFFTIGPKEAHAWTMKKGTTAPFAAGVIHTDFEKGFIRAEVISYEDYTKFNGELGAKENGKFRLEGKEYIMKDGDVVHFRFNV